MSALGDEFAYYQDRIGRERYFDTATERRSVRRHARLVDYYLHDGKGGSTWLDFSVNAAAPVNVISAGTAVWVPPLFVKPGEPAASRVGRSPSVYEVGHGIAQGHSGLTPPLGVLASQSNTYKSPTFNLRNGANELTAYQWDSSDTCLLVGSTSLDVAGHHAVDLPLEDFTNPDVPGKWVVLKTESKRFERSGSNMAGEIDQGNR